MKTIGYEVVSVGERELAGGIGPFLSSSEKARLSLTSASFVYRDNGEQLFAPFVVREYKLASGRSVKVGFVGLDALDTSFAKEAPGGRIVIMRDPVEAAREQIPALRSRVDFVVLLANLSLRDLTTILSATKGVDLALVSYGPRLSELGKFENVAGVPALYAGDQGKRLGEVRITFGKKGAAPSMTAGQVFLTKRYPSEPKLQDLVDRTIARVNEINRGNAERIAAATAGAPAGPVPSAGTPPAPPAPPAPRRGGPAVPAIETPAASGKPFVTAVACDACHSKEFEVYRTSAHARAFDTLVKANQDFNPECVKCHVTGFDQPHGFINARQTPDLANVQCEACHGNATDHVADPQKAFGRVPPRTCFTCHTKENSPDFVFYKYWNLIKH